ncbi:cytochrome c [Cognatishimia sp. SS12]|uniref:c-type cytochrome n=1 Tax=Cognatishimia sp. SS12 TaxID=2979465 RepID=UPI00232D1D0A|nr:cytochrome c [Cognatishimia sp. SS12]MDC0737558.1 cytochrome c [Cognatishimia sp. SS12]
MKFQKTIAAVLVITALTGAALAHSGVSDPHVKARMHAMGQAQQASKLLSNMARGRTTFDADAAAKAKAILIEVAAQTPALFTVNASDPVSEARASVWENFDDFTAKSQNMRDAAEALDVSDIARLGAGMRAVGQSCSSCHKSYRK